MRDFDLNLLDYLVEFKKAGSLSKAGETLSISQPAVSKAMRRLEEELGIPLFERGKNKLALSDNGKIVCDYAEDLLAIRKSIVSFAEDVKDGNEEVLIGMCAPGPIIYYKELLRKKSPFGRFVPEIVADEGMLKKGLFNGKYDLVFLSSSFIKEGYVCKKAFTETLFVSLPKDHFLAHSKGALSLSDLDGQTFLVDSRIGCWGEKVRAKLPNSRFIEQSDPSALKEMRQRSTLLAFQSDLTLSEEDENRVCLPLSDHEAFLTFYLATKKNWVHCYREFFA